MKISIQELIMNSLDTNHTKHKRTKFRNFLNSYFLFFSNQVVNLKTRLGLFEQVSYNKNKYMHL